MASLKFVQDLGEDFFYEPKQSATMVLATTPIDSPTSCVITVACYSISPETLIELVTMYKRLQIIISK